jgi:putative PIN family toxin of toxin-antitoxin system
VLPLRVVVDTNIVVSAALRPYGLPRTAFLLALTKPARMYVSQEILAEYRNVLARPGLKIAKGRQQQLLRLVRNRVQMVHSRYKLEVTSDPEDNKFLECADAARADYLITGNQRHFPRFWKNTKIITPQEFVSLVAPHLPI